MNEQVKINIETFVIIVTFPFPADVTADRFVQTKYEAQDFLSFKRRRRDTSTGPTDINEECCNERCRVEEISEYC